MADATSIPSSVVDSSKRDCSICHEKFQHPKILECMHNFCEKCLIKSQKSGFIICDLCNQNIKLPNENLEKLKTNFHLVGKLEGAAVREQLLSQDFRRGCGICELKNEAVSRCLDCSMYLCLSCQTVHCRIAALSEHTVATLVDLRSGKTAKIFRSQRGVDKFEMESARRKTIKEMTAKLQKALPEFKSTLEKIAAAGPEFNNHAANLEKQVKEFANKIRDKIAADELCLVLEIARIREEQEQTLRDSQKNMEAAIQCMTDSIETADDVADNASEWDFLKLYSIINNDLNSVINKRPADIYDGLPLWTFQPQHLECIGTLGRGAKVQKPPPLAEMKKLKWTFRGARRTGFRISASQSPKQPNALAATGLSIFSFKPSQPSSTELSKPKPTPVTLDVPTTTASQSPFAGLSFGQIKPSSKPKPTPVTSDVPATTASQSPFAGLSFGQIKPSTTHPVFGVLDSGSSRNLSKFSFNPSQPSSTGLSQPKPTPVTPDIPTAIKSQSPFAGIGFGPKPSGTQPVFGVLDSSSGSSTSKASSFESISQQASGNKEDKFSTPVSSSTPVFSKFSFKPNQPSSTGLFQLKPTPKTPERPTTTVSQSQFAGLSFGQITPSGTQPVFGVFGSSSSSSTSFENISQQTSKSQKEEDDDVIFVSEKVPTPEQRARAEKLLLPPNFFLYEDESPCPGCQGCEEEDLAARGIDYHTQKQQESSAPISTASVRETTHKGVVTEIDQKQHELKAETSTSGEKYLGEST